MRYQKIESEILQDLAKYKMKSLYWQKALNYPEE
jgi:hypothetical protein